MFQTDDEIFKEFGEKLKKLRIERELTQTDLAEQLGLSQSSIFKYEKGLRKVPINILKMFADYFNTSVDDLLGLNFTEDSNDNDDLKTPKSIQDFCKELHSLSATDDEIEKIREYAKFIFSNRKDEING